MYYLNIYVIYYNNIIKIDKIIKLIHISNLILYKLNNNLKIHINNIKYISNQITDTFPLLFNKKFKNNKIINVYIVNNIINNLNGYCNKYYNYIVISLQYDLLYNASTLLHEIGHLIGLNHINKTYNIMSILYLNNLVFRYKLNKKQINTFTKSEYNMKDYIVYLLINTKNKYTYVGITNNLIRRLRQHNKEIKGGAKYTSSKIGNGIWISYLQIINLSKSEALSIERTIKNFRKKAKGKTPLERRLYAINNTIKKYDNQPNIIIQI